MVSGTPVNRSRCAPEPHQSQVCPTPRPLLVTHTLIGDGGPLYDSRSPFTWTLSSTWTRSLRSCSCGGPEGWESPQEHRGRTAGIHDSLFPDLCSQRDISPALGSKGPVPCPCRRAWVVVRMSQTCVHMRENQLGDLLETPRPLRPCARTHTDV